MRKLIGNASLLVIGLIGGSAFTAFAADSSPRAAPARAKAPATAPAAPVNEPVEYRMLVLSSSSAPTAEHEKELNDLGAEGWRVTAPIYSGGILNSYLMSRTRVAK